MQVINFNQPYKIDNFNIKNIKKLNTFAGNGYYSKKAQHKLEKKYQFNKVLLTDSCTSALEIAALSLKLKKNDEVIIPSYSYPTTASAFLRCGYRIRFVDCNKNNPRINKKHFLSLINKRTKAVVIVHHAGQPEDITFFIQQKKKYKFKIIEDAAQCIDLKFKKKYLGSFGEFGCISFHESKNIHCGLGGALIINDKKFENLSHFIWERGTNRRDFNNNKVSKYTWIEIGSSFYPSELQSIVLNKQIDEIASIQKKRKKIYNYYSLFLRKLVTKNKIINMDESLISNYHMRYILLSNKFERDKLKFYLKKKNINSVTHYEPLHLSKIGSKLNKDLLVNAKAFSDKILRLPMHFYLNKRQILYICKSIEEFFKI